MVLDLATEDFYGLWELVWRAKTVAEASGDVVADEQLRAEVIRMCATGLLSLYKGRRFDGDQAEVSLAEAQTVLADPSNWTPETAADEHFRVAATAEGEAEYRRRFRS